MDWWAAILSLALTGFSLFLWYTMTYFKNTGIPHNKPYPFFGNMAPLVLRQTSFLDHIQKYYDRWPEAKYVAFYDLMSPVIILRDLDVIKSVGVKSFENFMNHRTMMDTDTDPVFGNSLFNLKDNKWKDVRTALTPSFTASKMRHMFELVSECAVKFSEHILKRVENGNKNIDAKDVFSRYTNDVIGTCAFGVTVDSMEEPKNYFYMMGKTITTFTAPQMAKMFFTRLCPNISRWLRVNYIDDTATRYFANVIKNNIEIRQKQGIVRQDLLQLMLEQEHKMDIVQMTAQSFVFFFAGFDTSSSMMSFASIALSKNQDIQNRLLEEIDQVMKETNGKPSYEAINAMAYLDAVCHETLRCYPVIVILDRECTQNFELPPAVPGGKPFTVKKGTNMWFPVSAIHSDPKNYEDPEKFNPDRFLGKKLNISMPSYLAFGIGPRSCIGNRFALIEAKLALFHVLSKCRVEVSDNLKEPITYSKNTLFFTGVIEGGFWVKFIPRTVNYK